MLLLQLNEERMSSIFPVKWEGTKKTVVVVVVSSSILLKSNKHTPRKSKTKQEKGYREEVSVTASVEERYSWLQPKVAQVQEESHHSLPVSCSMVLSSHTNVLQNCESSSSGRGCWDTPLAAPQHQSWICRNRRSRTTIAHIPLAL